MAFGLPGLFSVNELYMMEILEINDGLLAQLHVQAEASERKRMNRDLRTTPADNSQRMLNALQVGTCVPIHRHLKTSESTICLEGCMDVVFYDLKPADCCCSEEVKADLQGVKADATVIPQGMEECVYEYGRVRLCPREGRYGVQIPLGAWHSVEVYEPSTIFEAKDGAYGG